MSESGREKSKEEIEKKDEGTSKREERRKKIKAIGTEKTTARRTREKDVEKENRDIRRIAKEKRENTVATERQSKEGETLETRLKR
jgi:hypothetical protein